MAERDSLRRLHLWVGAASALVFLATGGYMRWVHEPPVEELDDGLRMLFRSRHIYLLFAALLNLLASVPGRSIRRRRLAAAGSALLVASPVLLLSAFVVETGALGAPSALSIYGVQAALGGTLLRLVA